MVMTEQPDGLPAKAAEVLAFWFEEAPATTAGALQAKLARWFGSEATSAETSERFGALIEEARGGGLADWETTPLGKLALCVLLDQLMRSHFGMEDSRAFAEAARAERLALSLFDEGIPDDWSAEQHFVALIPLGHSEDLAPHRRAMLESAALVMRAPRHLRPIWELVLAQLLRFTKVIEQFGRFPHRNVALGRASNPAELVFLREWKISDLARDHHREFEVARELEAQSDDEAAASDDD